MLSEREPSNSARRRTVALFFVGSIGAFVGITVCWMAFCLGTGGDFFTAGKLSLWLGVTLAGGAGAYAGTRMRSKALRLALGLLASACAAFWFAVPDGWWTLLPPHPLHVRTPRSVAAPLQGFTCGKDITGKRTNGRLAVSFVPSTANNVSFVVTFDGCDYRGEAALVEGRLNDGILGKVYVWTCHQSPESPYGVSCGPYLGSTLHTSVGGSYTTHRVSFQLPSTFRNSVQNARACRLPFMVYDAEESPQMPYEPELTFDLTQCLVSK